MRFSNKTCVAALEDLKHMTYEEVGAKYGVSKTTLVRWRSNAKQYGAESEEHDLTSKKRDARDEGQEESLKEAGTQSDATNQEHVAKQEDKATKPMPAAASQQPKAQPGPRDLTPYLEEGDADDEVLELVAILAAQIEKLKNENSQLRRSLQILLE